MNKKLKKHLEKSKRTVFFGGAGTSTESGIPDFRSADGLYNMQNIIPPEKILSHTFFKEHTKEFYDFYREKMIYLHAEPNAAHYALARLEDEEKLIGLITQNIDGLHQKAGSKNVFELHGSIHRNYCMRCKKFYPVEKIAESEGIPFCDCGGIIKPDVVLYEEALDEKTIENSINAICNADLLIVGGTSLNVFPAAGLLQYFNGDDFIIINKSKTDFDSHATLLINQPIATVFA